MPISGTATNLNIGALYRRPIQATRTGPLNMAFSYPTRIDAEVVAVFIASHTSPGATVLDVFGGSGSTGIAARLCDTPTDRMRRLAAAAGVTPTWGPRHAIVYELSPLGAALGDVMSNPPDPDEFMNAAERLLDETSGSLGWMYDVRSPSGELSQMRHVIWSEVLQTPCCGSRISLWDAAVRFDPLRILTTFACPSCRTNLPVKRCPRALEPTSDPGTGDAAMRRVRVPARVYGRSEWGTWRRDPTPEDLDVIRATEGLPVPASVPSDPITWGDLRRAGYHEGIETFRDLYTRRNLLALGALWERASAADEPLRRALQLLVLSYNATHSTLMTRVVVKDKQDDFVVSGAQSGVLYVSGLPVEKNVFEGVRRKVRTFAEAFALTRGSRSRVEFVNASSTKLALPDASVDYAFTDPPFGDFIPYAEVNQVNEVWLGHVTDRTEEAIVSPAQGKGPAEYSRLLEAVFSEVRRVLHGRGSASVVFHASKPAIWGAFTDALAGAGLTVEKTNILDKQQVSFKQAVHEGGTRGDAVMLLRPAERDGVAVAPAITTQEMVHALIQDAQSDLAELQPRRLFSRYVARCAELGLRVELTAPDFYGYVRAISG